MLLYLYSILRYAATLCFGMLLGYAMSFSRLKKPKNDEETVLPEVALSNRSNLSELLFTSLDSVSTESTESTVDVQREILTTLARVRAINEFQERNGEKYWESSGRVISCPSKMMTRANFRDNLANSDDAIKNWVQKFSKSYKSDGVFLLPAYNVAILMDELLSESSYIIVKIFCKESCSKAGLEFSEIFDHEEIDDEICMYCTFKEGLSTGIHKILFICHFYKEMLCYQIFQNTSVSETESFIQKLYDELSNRYSDEFMDFPFVESCTDDLQKDYKLTKYYNYARIAAQQWAELLYRLGTKVKLPFKPIEVISKDTDHIFRTTDVNIFEENQMTTEIFKF